MLPKGGEPQQEPSRNIPYTRHGYKVYESMADPRKLEGRLDPFEDKVNCRLEKVDHMIVQSTFSNLRSTLLSRESPTPPPVCDSRGSPTSIYSPYLWQISGILREGTCLTYPLESCGYFFHLFSFWCFSSMLPGSIRNTLAVSVH